MVKTKFSSLDVRAMVNSVRPSVVGCKLTNIYDINSRVYILKLARRGFKCFLLVESGVRFHLTNYERDKSSVPSNYTMKLRKHIRTRRLTAIEQLACDRRIDITFGRGENSFHLIVELFVGGNVILTDSEYRIVALLRAHSSETCKVAIKEIYPMDNLTKLMNASISEFPAAIEKLLGAIEQRQETQEVLEMDMDDERAKQSAKKGGLSAFAKRSKKRVNHNSMGLVQVLQKLLPFADPGLCANSVAKAMKSADMDCPNAFKVTVDDMSFEELVEIEQKAAEFALETLQSVSRPCDLGGGSMPTIQVVDEGDDQDIEEDEVAEERGESAPNPEPVDTDAVVLGWIQRKYVNRPPTGPYWANDEFTPLQPEVSLPDAVLPFSSFHQCVDEFYSTLESTRAAEQQAQHAKSVFDKVERIRVDQERRIDEMEALQAVAERQAWLIEKNVDLVDTALTMVNTMVASQIDWADLWREIKRQQRLGHVLAQHIYSLELNKNKMQFLLADEDEDNADMDDRPMEVVTLHLDLTSHANVSMLHSQRKTYRTKTAKTVSSGEAAVKQAEKKAQQDVQKFQFKQTIRRVRQTWWFEKFFWFISSENFLVIAAHDQSQLDHIFSKYLGPGDIFVQADVTGARTCFIRNPGGGTVPPATLREAGTMALCHSIAWTKRIVISAWSVPIAQVSRGGPPPKGNYVLVDGFYVEGRTYPTPPLQLEMGVSLLFCVSDKCSENHKGERKSRYLEATAAGASEDEESQDSSDEEECIEDAIGGRTSVDEDEQSSEGDQTGNQGDNVDANDGELDANQSAEVEQDKSEDETAQHIDEAQETNNEAYTLQDVEVEHSEEMSGQACEAVVEQGDVVEKTGRTRMSKAERRKQKKGGQAAVDEHPSPASVTTGPTTEIAKTKSTKAEPAKPLPRGQRAKAKKVKEKYGDQDEDERILRLALLGSKATKFLSSPSANEVSGIRSEMNRETENKDHDQECADRNEGKAIAGATDGQNVDGQVGTTEKINKGTTEKGNKGTSSQGCVNLKAGWDAEDRSAHETQLARLDLLTGQPKATDEVLYVMPMVAPYCATSGPYTYRAKLTPGPGKKGQVVRQCMRMFEAQLERHAWKVLLQAVPESEATCLMCGTCKASMAGMQKLQQQVKKDVKKEKREKGGATPPDTTGKT